VSTVMPEIRDSAQQKQMKEMCSVYSERWHCALFAECWSPNMTDFAGYQAFVIFKIRVHQVTWTHIQEIIQWTLGKLLFSVRRWVPILPLRLWEEARNLLLALVMKLPQFDILIPVFEKLQTFLMTTSTNHRQGISNLNAKQ